MAGDGWVEGEQVAGYQSGGDEHGNAKAGQPGQAGIPSSRACGTALTGHTERIPLSGS